MSEPDTDPLVHCIRCGLHSGLVMQIINNQPMFDDTSPLTDSTNISSIGSKMKRRDSRSSHIMAVISYGSQGTEISETGTGDNSDDQLKYSDGVVPREGASAPLVPVKKVISKRTASVSALSGTAGSTASASQTGGVRRAPSRTMSILSHVSNALAQEHKSSSLFDGTHQSQRDSTPGGKYIHVQELDGSFSITRGSCNDDSSSLLGVFSAASNAHVVRKSTSSGEWLILADLHRLELVL